MTKRIVAFSTVLGVLLFVPALAHAQDATPGASRVVGAMSSGPEATDPMALFEAARVAGDRQGMLTALTAIEEQATPEIAATYYVSAASTVLAQEGGPRLRREARDLAERAVTLDGSNVDGYFVRLDAELYMEDAAAARATLRDLDDIAPNHPQTAFFHTIALANAGDWEEARLALDRAHDLGLSDDVYQGVSAELEAATPWHSGLGAHVLTGSKVVAVWLLIFGALLLLGVLLSRATLTASRSMPTSVSVADAAPLSAGLRRAYAVVLWMSCGFYYLSLPLVVILVLAVAAGLIGGIFMIGYIPVKLVALIGIAALVSVYAVGKSLFVRVKDEDPGPELDLSEHPELSRVLGEVADKVGTEKVHHVYLTPGTELAVFERGGVGQQLRGSADRCLILGAAVLEGMDQQAFKAIIAHEYGHFVNRDTAGGGFALAVRRSLYKMAVGLAEGGAAAWYNPAWLFLRAFERVFVRISHGASRLQEVLADRWAAVSYGARAFERGLRHVVTAGIRFDAHANSTLNEVIDGQRALSNFYHYQPEENASPEDIDQAIREQLDREASVYDSHPAPTERFQLVHALEMQDPKAPEEELSVWDLFADRGAIEEMMTEEIRRNVLQSTGFLIPQEQDDPPHA